MMSKPLPILDQMPWNVKRAIVDSSDNETKIELCRCSKELNEHVKDSKIDVETLWCSLRGYQAAAVRLQHSNGSLNFRSTANGCIKTTNDGDKVTKIEGVDSISASVEQLMKVFKNQAFHFSSITMNFECDPSSDLHRQYVSQFTEKLKEEMSKLSHRISVGEFKMYNHFDPDQILDILPHIKPSRKFSLTLCPMSALFFALSPDRAAVYFSEIDLSKIAETEQWKRAKDVELRHFNVPVDCPETMSIPSLLFNVPNLIVKDVKFIVENITRKDGWRERSISCQNVDKSVMGYLSNFRVGQRGGEYDYEVPGVNGVPCYAHVRNCGRSGKKLWFRSDSERPKSYYYRCM